MGAFNDIEYTLQRPPPYVGAWRVGGAHGIRFNMTKRPSWLARVMAKCLLQWEWIDAE